MQRRQLQSAAAHCYRQLRALLSDKIQCPQAPGAGFRPKVGESPMRPRLCAILAFPPASTSVRLLRLLQRTPPRSFPLPALLALDHEPRSSLLVMSSARDPSQSSLTTPATEESFAHVLSSPSRGNRKSPPPPKLNLEDCKPVFSATEESNAAPSPSTSFVFTSSRTLRNLHNYSPSLDDAGPHPPVSSPTSSNGSQSPGRQPRAPGRPLLSPAQLARHSMGAVDARCIVSPKMRAAGFVPLPHSPAHQSSNTSGPSSPVPSPVPTPVEPPRFPPIVFFNPSNVTTTPLWDYQRNLQYGLPSGGPFVTSEAQEARQSASRPNIRPLANASSTPSSSTLVSSDPSHSSLFSMSSSRSSMTSVSSSDIHSPDGGKPPGQRALMQETVDGYPFPATPPRSRTQSYAPSAKGKQVVDAATSPTISSSTMSGSATPLAASPTPPSPSTSGSTSGSAQLSSGSGSMSPAPRARPSLRDARRGSSSLSITELCQASPRAWFTDSLFLPQSTAVSAPRSNTAASASGSRSSLSRVTNGRLVGAETQSRRSTAVSEVSADAGEVHARADLPKKSTAQGVSQEAEDDEVLKEKKRERHRGREKDREVDREKERERRRRHKAKSMKAAEHSSSSATSSPTSSPTSATPSPPRREGKAKERARVQASDLSRSVIEKAPGAAQFSSFTFPPRHTRSEPGGPHTLGSPDPLLQREREREEAEFAKDAVLAHRERDRLQYSDRERRASHRKLVPAAPTSAYTSTYDRGRGRAIRGSERRVSGGREPSVASVQSMLSGDTVFYDEHPDLAEHLVDPVEA